MRVLIAATLLSLLSWATVAETALATGSWGLIVIVTVAGAEVPSALVAV